MDFGQFNTRDAAETGRLLHIKHLKTGKPLYDGGKPVGVLCRGIESDTVRAAAAKANRARMEGASDDDDLSVAKAVVIRFQGIEREGKPLGVTDDDLRWFFGLSSKLVQAVISFAREPGNFLPAVSDD